MDKYKSAIKNNPYSNYLDYFESEEFKNKVQKSYNGRITYLTHSEDYGNGIIKIISSDGIDYYKNDKLHREDGPAVIKVNGDIEWYTNGKLHRNDGPAKVGRNQAEQWYLNGELHREDGPAVISEKYSMWYYNGQIHRENGPAIIRDRGNYENSYEKCEYDPLSLIPISKWSAKIEYEYYLHNKQYTEDDFFQIQKLKKTSKNIKI